MRISESDDVRISAFRDLRISWFRVSRISRFVNFRNSGFQHSHFQNLKTKMSDSLILSDFQNFMLSLFWNFWISGYRDLIILRFQHFGKSCYCISRFHDCGTSGMQDVRIDRFVFALYFQECRIEYVFKRLRNLKILKHWSVAILQVQNLEILQPWDLRIFEILNLRRLDIEIVQLGCISKLQNRICFTRTAPTRMITSNR